MPVENVRRLVDSGTKGREISTVKVYTRPINGERGGYLGCASLLIASGAADMQVANQMGHSKIEATKPIYGHPFAQDQASILKATNYTVTHLHVQEDKDGSPPPCPVEDASYEHQSHQLRVVSGPARGASHVVAPRRRSRHARLEGRPSRRGRQLTRPPVIKHTDQANEKAPVARGLASSRGGTWT